ncbi:MAG: polysaccharide deacetylase family protein [Candidatus Saccharibacteria bacterium]
MKRLLFWGVIAAVAGSLSFGAISILRKPMPPYKSVAQKKLAVPFPREILGQSPRLSGKDLVAMNLWKQKVYGLAREYKGRIFLNGDTTNKNVCLTFDDGPDQVVTPQVINTLKSYNVKGSFFFIGKRVERYPKVVLGAYTNGDLVLNHSFTHPRLDLTSPLQVKQELTNTEQAIFNVIGRRPLLMRPPYGGIDAQVVEDVYDQGCKAVLWSMDTLDWTGKTPEEITQSVLANVRPGDIILFHTNENRIATAQALPGIITGLQERGYKILDLAQMLNTDAYK